MGSHLFPSSLGPSSLQHPRPLAADSGGPGREIIRGKACLRLGGPPRRPIHPPDLGEVPWLRTGRPALGARPTEASTLKQAETRQREAAAEPGPRVVVGRGQRCPRDRDRCGAEMHAGPGSLSEGGRGGRPSSAKPWGERQQLASRPQGSRRRAPARPGRAAAARGEARSRQTEQSGRLAGRPPGGGFAAVWRFCHISDSQKGRGGRTQLFLAETVSPGGLGALRPDPGLPVTGASPGPSGQLGLSEGPARSWLPSLHLALGLSSGPRPRASGRGGVGRGPRGSVPQGSLSPSWNTDQKKPCLPAANCFLPTGP